MSLQDSIEARSLILLFLGLLLGPWWYLTPVSTNQFQCTAGPNSNPLNPGGKLFPLDRGVLEELLILQQSWEVLCSGRMDRARRQQSHIPLPSEKTMEKQKPKPGGPHDAELCWTPQHSRRKQSPSLRELLWGFSWEANTYFVPPSALPKWGKLWRSLGAG